MRSRGSESACVSGVGHAAAETKAMFTLINPLWRAEPFDRADWVFEAKFDGFRAAADTVRGRLISRNGNRMKRFEGVLDLLPGGHVFDGELVVLDGAGRPLFKQLLFGRRRPTYVAFDLLMAEGIDLRPLPLKRRKAMLARIGEGAERWIALTNGIVGEGRALYRAVVEADLEGIVRPTSITRSSRAGTRFSIGPTRSAAAAEWFRERRGRSGRR
jgi:bifunctional non-homologous end joining protein LigD